jgi:uncharacterized membrane protein
MDRIKAGLKIIALIAGLHVMFHLLWVTGPQSVQAAEEEKRPSRALTMAVEYPGVEIPAGEDVKMDIIFYNTGRSNEDVEIRIAEKPEGWKAAIKTYRFEISAVHVPAGEDKRISFEAEPAGNPVPGEYVFRLVAQTPDGRFKLTRDIRVKIKSREEGVGESKGVKLTTSYPVLRGPSDAEFEFSMEVESKLDQDAVFELFGQGPEGWQINFKPAYESKFISSLRLRANGSSTVAVQVKPPPNIGAGTHPINVRVSSGDAEAEAVLTVALTGTYKLKLGTPNGLLSLDAGQGQPSNLSVYVKNEGSAAIGDISFMSFKPENWKVEFKPERLPTLNPGDLQQVEVIITPFADALVGDYLVTLKVDGEQTSDTAELRVTVKASAAWSWIGIGIIIAVIGGLTYLFRKMGRR